METGESIFPLQQIRLWRIYCTWRKSTHKSNILLPLGSIITIIIVVVVFIIIFIITLMWDSWWGETSSAAEINDKIPTVFHRAMHNQCDLILFIKILFKNSINETEIWLKGHYVYMRFWHAMRFFFKNFHRHHLLQLPQGHPWLPVPWPCCGTAVSHCFLVLLLKGAHKMLQTSDRQVLSRKPRGNSQGKKKDHIES